MKKYVGWREEARGNAGKLFAKLTQVDPLLGHSALHLVMNSRPGSSELVSQCLSITRTALNLLKTSKECVDNPEQYWKYAARAVQVCRNDPQHIIPFFEALKLLDADSTRSITQHSKMAHSFSYFKCLAAYINATSRSNQSAKAEAALSVWSAALSQLLSSISSSPLCQLIEKLCIELAKLTLRWHDWQSKPSSEQNEKEDSRQSKFENQLSTVTKTLHSVSKSISVGSLVHETGL